MEEEALEEGALEEEAALEEVAVEEEAVAEEAAVEARPAEGAEVERDDELASGAAEDEASETDDMDELPGEAEEAEEPRATGAKRTRLEPASWDDEGAELEPETSHGDLQPMDRNTLTTRCRSLAARSSVASAPSSAARVRARLGRCIQEYFESEGLYKLMTKSARRRADLVSAIRTVQV